MAPTAVVFDLDYTLAVPERDRATLLAAATDATGAPSLSRDAYRRAHRETAHGTTREPIFEALLEGTDASADPTAVTAAYREAVADAMTPIDGAEALIADLRECYVVGLLTDGPARAGRSKLEALGWSELFDAAVVTGEVGADKPDPRGFEAVCDRLEVQPGEAVYVGDDPDLDVAGATAAGMVVVQVLYEGGPDLDPRADATVRRADLATALPDAVADLR